MNKRRSFGGLLAAIILIFLLAGCSVTRNLGPNQYLLTKNKIHVSDRNILVEDLESYLQQVPNTKTLGLFRPNIAIYNWGARGKDSKFKTWLRKKVGTEPVILDTSLVTVAGKQMKLYMGNRGYFQSVITDSLVLKKKKATVIYRVLSGKPYKIRKFAYSIPDTQLARYVYIDTSACLIHRGKNFDSYELDNERTRITTNLKNWGFYRFSANYIKYTIDTNLRSRQCDITLEIVNQVVPSLENFYMVEPVPHKRYFIDKIFVYPEFDHILGYAGPYDTLVREFRSSGKNQPPGTYYFLSNGNFRVKPRTIAQSIFITPRSNYNLKDVDQTYSQLSSLQVFKYINIQFSESSGSAKKTAIRDLVNCRVELSRAPAHSFSVTTDGTNSAGAFGVQANVGYQNRNIFRGAQLLRINLSGSLQMQATAGTTAKTFFNVFELGANANLTFPQFLVPIKPESISKYFKPKTTISIGYNFQKQQHYNRHISNASFGYTWLQKEVIRHMLNPIELSMVKIFTDSYFDSTLQATQDMRTRNQYTDHLVAGLKYTFTFSNQQFTRARDFFYVRANLETGGNLFYGLGKLFNMRRDSVFRLFGLTYSQYIRPDIDFRYYDVYPNKHSVVYRVYAGIGVPYGNSSLLPFEKAFFAGGANDMRGWRMYTLGPGSYSNANNNFTYNQIGDIQLEANVEYRFPIYDWIRGAVYVDAGNIWLLKSTKDLPGGQFIFPDFFSEIALDGGIGIRLDFDFFIFRLDPAIPLRVPSYPTSDRWFFNKMQIKDIVWNFGIGYPF